MTQRDIHEDLRRAISDAGASFQGDGNIVFINIGQLEEVVATFARRAVIEQQDRCRNVCLRVAEARDHDDPKSAAALRECAAQIEVLGH